MQDGARSKERLIAGLLAGGVWGWHALDSVWAGSAVDLLWMCNLGGLLLSASLLSGSTRGLSVAASWLLFGVPLWALDLAAGGQTTPSSVASHLGGLSIAVWGVMREGWARRASLWASAALAGLMLICRGCTPPEANVNLVFEVWTVWEGAIGHGAYVVFLGTLASAVFVAIDVGVGAAMGRWSRAP